MLSTVGRRIRGVAVVVVMVILLVGSAWGADDHFPFGPFRMFSTANNLDGVVSSVEVIAIDKSGAEVRVSFSSLGLRRAEVEGQLERFQNDPGLLAGLITAYERLGPDKPELSGVRLERIVTRLKDGYPVSESRRSLVEWIGR